MPNDSDWDIYLITALVVFVLLVRILLDTVK